MKMLTQTINSN